MKTLVVLLVALSVTLGVTVWQLESRPPEIVQPAEELPWAIFLYKCGEPLALVWTTEPPTWFTPEDNFDAEQVIRMDKIVRAGQTQAFNLAGTICTTRST